MSLRLLPVFFPDFLLLELFFFVVLFGLGGLFGDPGSHPVPSAFDNFDELVFVVFDFVFVVVFLPDPDGDFVDFPLELLPVELLAEGDDGDSGDAGLCGVCEWS